MSKVTTRQALDRIRRNILTVSFAGLGLPPDDKFSDEQVTINKDNVEQEEKCVTIACTGFPINRRNEKLDNRRFITFEYRQTVKRDEITGLLVDSVDDILDIAYNLANVMIKTNILGISLEPDQDAFEGMDPKYEDVYMVAWRYLAILP